MKSIVRMIIVVPVQEKDLHKMKKKQYENGVVQYDNNILFYFASICVNHEAILNYHYRVLSI